MILFVSSNPGADSAGSPPRPDWSLTNEDSNEALFLGADSAFEPSQRPGITAGVRLVDRYGNRHGHPVTYWRWAKRTAGELLRREVIPGQDYALTEVVHCGSKEEGGVAAARGVCTRRYLRRVLQLSPATVVIVVGGHARQSFREEFDVDLPVGEVWGPKELLGRRRLLAGLSHPSRVGVRWGLENALGQVNAAQLVDTLRPTGIPIPPPR